MNAKRPGAYVAIVFGVILLAAGGYVNSKFEKAKGYIDSATGIIPDKLGKDKANEALHEKVDKYHPIVTILYVAGGVLAAYGASSILFKKKK